MRTHAVYIKAQKTHARKKGTQCVAFRMPSCTPFDCEIGKLEKIWSCIHDMYERFVHFCC